MNNAVINVFKEDVLCLNMITVDLFWCYMEAVYLEVFLCVVYKYGSCESP